MAQHGYLRDFDEGSDRGNGRGLWRDEDRERGWRGDFPDRDRDRGFMVGGERFSGGSGWERALDFRSRQDDQYLSWRDKQMAALDRDYAEYRAEREQEFQRDFDSWRRRRRSHPQPLQTGMTQTGLSADSTGELQLTPDKAIERTSGSDPMETATLGTSSSRGR
jgi:hypothetical protein